MALDASLLSLLMFATSGLTTPAAKNEFDAYAEGIINGLKLGTVTVTTVGVQGSPGGGTFLGAVNPGPVFLASLIQIGSVGFLPPIPGGTPTPLQVTYFLALAQIATFILTNLQVQTIPADTVAVGVGIVAPGGFIVLAPAIQLAIITAFLERSIKLTPSRLGLILAVANGIQQLMLLATIPSIPIIGGVPVPPPTGPIPAVGVRVGQIS